jgi:hypothetical protein
MEGKVMGTFPTDFSSTGLCHAAPPAIPARRAPRLALRWQEWLPWCTIEARRHSDPASHLYHLRQVHRSRVISLLGARLRWPIIRKHRLDDPIMPSEAFEFQLRTAIERRRVRMNRVKGQRRERV